MSTQEQITLAVLGSMALFILITGILVVLIIKSQKRKFRDREALHAEREKNSRELVQSKLEVEEQTRSFIARELHDNIGTISSLVKMNLNLVSSATSESQKTELLEESKSLVRTLIQEVKLLALSLQRDRLSQTNLVHLLQFETDRIRKLDVFKLNYTVSGEERPLPNDDKIVLFRICQELLHNAMKHSQAFVIWVDVLFENNQLAITIRDDGQGFDTAENSTRNKGVNGSGLINVYNRIEVIKGKITLETGKGTGTKWYIEVPYTNHEYSHQHHPRG